MEEEKQETIIQPTPEIKKHWEKLSLIYSIYNSENLIPHALTMAHQVNISSADVIIDAGCGDGSFTTEICLQKKKSTKLISIDISQNMCKFTYCRVKKLAGLMNEPFGLSNYKAKLQFEKMNDFEKSEDFNIKESRTIPELNCEVFQSDIEDLSFIEDNTVDCYISPMCLMIVENPLKMIKEAYRVLQPGKKAIFSVWGRKGNDENFTLLNKVLEDHDIPVNKTNGRSIYHLNDKEKLIKMFEDAGFKKCIAWNQYIAFRRLNLEEQYEMQKNYVDMKLKEETEEKRVEITKDFVSRLEEVMNKENKPLGYDSLIICGEK